MGSSIIVSAFCIVPRSFLMQFEKKFLRTEDPNLQGNISSFQLVFLMPCLLWTSIGLLFPGMGWKCVVQDSFHLFVARLRAVRRCRFLSVGGADKLRGCGRGLRAGGVALGAEPGRGGAGLVRGAQLAARPRLAAPSRVRGNSGGGGQRRMVAGPVRLQPSSSPAQR